MKNLKLKTRKSIEEIINLKRPIVCLTAYTKPIAKLIDKFVDIILVGDSLGTVIYDFESTREVTLEMMINHAKAVVKSTRNAFVVVDLPYESLKKSKKNVFNNCMKILSETGADAIKLEGGSEVSDVIEYLVSKGINVMGHVGMLPQSIKSKKKYKVYGKQSHEKLKVLKDIISLEKAGVFAVVIEATIESLASELSKKTSVPTIGIGASKDCSGQILVTEDLIGLTDFNARFVKNYALLSLKIELAVKKYSKEVKNKKFPNNKYVYTK